MKIITTLTCCLLLTWFSNCDNLNKPGKQKKEVSTNFITVKAAEHSNGNIYRKNNIFTVSDAGVSIEKYGAKANDNTFDNAPAIIKALKNNNLILIPSGKIFTIKSTIEVTGLNYRSIVANGATIINRNYDARTFLFINCSNIKITGGTYTRNVLPTRQNGKAQSTISFQSCKNVTVTRTHITRSPEMGIDNNIVIGGTYTYNKIDHCLRDGIYAHYSAELNYIGNVLNEIKDDALSMHDYGLDNQKDMLHQAGYKQAGHSVISLNTITNCVQGISSIACDNIIISKNKITNTAHAGICVFNSEDLFLNSTARVNNIRILNNILTHTGFTVNINTLIIKNTALTASGRAAIFVACNWQGHDYNLSKMRSSFVEVSGNTINDCATNAATLYNIDGLILKDNNFTNCHSDTKNFPSFTGHIVEIKNCTSINVLRNNITDSRPQVLHDSGYIIQNTTGVFKKGIIKGFKEKDVLIDTFSKITQ